MLSPEHQKAVEARGFTPELVKFFSTQNGHPPILQSLSAEEIQVDRLNVFPTMENNDGGALQLRFNENTYSLRPDNPDWNEKKKRFSKYLYGKSKPNTPKGTNTQPWIPSEPPTIATEGLFDALVATFLIGTPCAGATAPSHVRYSNFPESVKVYISDADVPYHHFTGLLPVVIGQCREKGLKLAHLPRNPNADYAYTETRIPEDCKWGMEEWCKEWKEQGLNPKAELQKVINGAQEPVEYLRSIFLDYGKAGIQYPINSVQLTTGARAIADATERRDQRLMLRDLLASITKAPKKWIDEQVGRRDTARFQEQHDQAVERQRRVEQGLEEPLSEPEPIEIDPYQISGGRPIDVHISNLLLDGETLYGSAASSLFAYMDNAGFWSRISQQDALQMIQSHVERVYTANRDGLREFGYGTSAQVSSCLTSLIIKANNAQLANPEPCIPFLDQTYNCKTGQPESHSASHGATYGVNAQLILIEECPKTFFDAISTCYGEEALPVIRAWIRAIVDPTIPYGKFLLIVGLTGTGKGLLLEFLDSLLPTTCCSSLEEPGDINSADKVYQFILGKRYVSFHDLPARLKPMQLFYKLVENVAVSARKLNASDSSPINPNCRFSAGTPRMPTLSDANDGITRRALVLTTNPRDGKPDRNLKASVVGNTAEHQQLRAEVIGWALSMPKQDVINTLYGDAAADYLDGNLRELEDGADAVAHFMDECLTLTEGEVTDKVWADLYEAFKAYCDANGFSGKGSKFHFQGKLRGKVPHLHRKRGKESIAAAQTAGRDRETRINLSKKDWGYALRSQGFKEEFGGRIRVVHELLTSGLLQQLRDHKPPCPPDSGLIEESTVRQDTDSGSKNPVPDKADAWSQGSSLNESKEIKDTHINTHNACAPSPFSIEQPAEQITLRPLRPQTVDDLPDWVEPPPPPVDDHSWF